MMRILIIFICLISSLPIHAATAIYYSKSENLFFGRMKKKTLNEALELARDDCLDAKLKDCVTLVYTEQPGYGAVASGYGFIAASLAGNSKKEAAQKALSQCKAEARGCRIISSFYDPIPAPPPPPVQQCYGVNGPAPCGSLYDYGGYNIYTGKQMYNHGGTGSTP